MNFPGMNFLRGWSGPLPEPDTTRSRRKKKPAVPKAKVTATHGGERAMETINALTA